MIQALLLNFFFLEMVTKLSKAEQSKVRIKDPDEDL